jgi:hypothetical protein
MLWKCIKERDWGVSTVKWTTPNSFVPLKQQGLEIENWDGMQPLHKIYGLIKYLTFTIYSYNKI